MKSYSKLCCVQVILRDAAGQDVNKSQHVVAQLCYHTLGLVHSIWSPIPGGLKDYIGSPKANGYRSLDTVVVPLSLPFKSSLLPLQVQIRTTGMDALAELGIAGPAHGNRQAQPKPGDDGQLAALSGGRPLSKHALCATASGTGKVLSVYTNRALRQVAAAPTSDTNWLTSIKTFQDEFGQTMSAKDFVESVTKEVLGTSVFVYTDTGQLKRLPKVCERVFSVFRR